MVWQYNILTMHKLHNIELGQTGVSLKKKKIRLYMF